MKMIILTDVNMYSMIVNKSASSALHGIEALRCDTAVYEHVGGQNLTLLYIPSQLFIFSLCYHIKLDATI